MGRPARRRRNGINGLPEVQAFLSSIPKELNRQAVPVVNAMLAPVVSAMRKYVKATRTGLLKKSLTKKVRQYASGIVWGAVGPDKAAAGLFGKRVRRTARPRAYAHLVNRGTLPHAIKFKTRDRTMRHPGTRPEFFQESALQASKGAAIAKGVKKLADVLRKFNAKGST